MTNYFVSLWKEEWLENLREARESYKMLEDLYENNTYEVLKSAAEDRSAWRESTRNKVPKPAAQQTAEKE